MKNATRFGSGILRARSILFLGIALLVVPATVRAQSNTSEELNLTLQPGTHNSAPGAKLVYRHARAANTAAGKSLHAKEVASGRASTANTNSSDDGGILRYPGTLSYQGGPVVDSAEFHAVYLLPNGHCHIAACWGDPEGFLRDLGKSDFIHLLDQYVGLQSSNRYSVGFRAKVSYTPPTVPLTDNDIESVVYLVASATGATGYGHIYHVFLPPGQDECFDSTDSECYSPDNPTSFFFCGYHSSVDFSDIGHVLYTVEPYQDVVGCQVKPGTPNGQLVDSTDNVLNHESFETISDPDGTAWWNTTSLAMNGDENGDECEFLAFQGQSVFFDVPFIRINGKRYGVQSIYSNDVNACGTAP